MRLKKSMSNNMKIAGNINCELTDTPRQKDFVIMP